MIWFMLTSFGGFGCEGAVEPCTPHYGTFLRGLAIIAGAAFALAILINAVIARLRQ